MFHVCMKLGTVLLLCQCTVLLLYCSNNYSILQYYTCIFYRTERLPCRGGRGRLLTPQQETEIVNMVGANNAITLKQIQTQITEDQDVFQNIDRVSLSTLDRVLRRNHLRMKQVYRVPFERNSERVKELRYDYVQVRPMHSNNVIDCIQSALYRHITVL